MVNCWFTNMVAIGLKQPSKDGIRLPRHHLPYLLLKVMMPLATMSMATKGSTYLSNKCRNCCVVPSGNSQDLFNQRGSTRADRNHRSTLPSTHDAAKTWLFHLQCPAKQVTYGNRALIISSDRALIVKNPTTSADSRSW